MNRKTTLVVVAVLIAIALFFVPWNRHSTGVPQKVKLINGPSINNDAMAMQLLRDGKPLLIGGLAILGDKGYIVRTVCFLQQTGKNADSQLTGLKGWSYFVDQWPGLKHRDLRHFDTAKNEITELALPNYMTYFIAEIDPSLLESTANKRELKEAADYAITFIHD